MKVCGLLVAMLVVAGIAQAADREITLRNPQGGSVMLLRAVTHPDIPNVSPGNRVCTSPNGEQAQVLEQAAGSDSPVVWLRIQVITGSCAGQVGWISAQNAQIN